MDEATLKDARTPDKVPAILRQAADWYREARAELQRDWQDPNAGRVWSELAKVLDRAADRADKVVKDWY